MTRARLETTSAALQPGAGLARHSSLLFTSTRRAEPRPGRLPALTLCRTLAMSLRRLLMSSSRGSRSAAASQSRRRANSVVRFAGLTMILAISLVIPVELDTSLGVLADLGRSRAKAQETTFTGSIQAAYLLVPTQREDLRPPGVLLDGLTTESSIKVAVDFDANFAATVRACFGCHGFEVDSAQVDFTPFEQLRVHVGRFQPAFGDFTTLRDPANHQTVDQPLPYDMGRMVRMREWNLGILPAPYVEQGVQIDGSIWFDLAVQLQYAVYLVTGLRGDSTGFDLDWLQARSVGSYYIDNNTVPSGGGRLSITVEPGAEYLFSLGASATGGVYDPDEALEYLIAGADFFARLGPVDIRMEYMMRRTEMAIGDSPATRFAYGPDRNGRFPNYMLKDGFYVFALWTVVQEFELFGRVDGLRRVGNTASTSRLRFRSAVLRYTLGANVVLDHGIRIKAQADVYDFSDFRDEFAASLGVVAAF